MKKILLSFLISASFALPAFANKKIAVLPLSTSSTKEEVKQFSLGTMASLSYALGKISGYTVVDRGQIEALMKEIGFQNSGLADSDGVKFGKISGVNIIVGGTIQESNGNYRININFTDVQTNNIIKTFQVTGKDIFELQDKLSSEILKDTDITVKSLMETTNSEAYNYFVEAKELSVKFNKKDLERSLLLLNKSIKKDHDYVSAKSLRAKVNATLALVLKNSGVVYLDKFSSAELEAESILEADSKNINAYDAMYIIYEVEGKRDNLSEISNKYPKDKNIELSDLNFKIGNFYFKQNKFVDAEYFFLQAVKHDNKNAFYNYQLALIYRRQKNNEKSLEFLLEALKLSPDAFYIKYSVANNYYFVSKYNESLAMYLDIIKTGTDNENDFLYSGLGDTYSALKKYDEAIKAYKKTIELNPKESYHYYRLGELYFELNDFETAESLYNKALEVNKDDDISTVSLALVYEKKGKKEEALAKLKQAVKMNKNSMVVRIQLINFYERSKMYLEMVKELNEQIKDGSSKPNYPINQKLYNLTKLSEGYSELHDYENAIKNIKIAIEQEEIIQRKNYKLSKLKDYYLYYGIDKYKEKKYAEAIELYNKALDVSYSKDLEKSQNVSLYNNIGISYYMISQFDKAIENYKKALELNPNHTDAKTNLEMAYEAIGKKAEALIEYKKACDLGIKDKCGIK